jgi:hypothetical protein
MALEFLFITLDISSWVSALVVKEKAWAEAEEKALVLAHEWAI